MVWGVSTALAIHSLEGFTIALAIHSLDLSLPQSHAQRTKASEGRESEFPPTAAHGVRGLYRAGFTIALDIHSVEGFTIALAIHSLDLFASLIARATD